MRTTTHEKNRLFKQGQIKPRVACRVAWRVGEGQQSYKRLQQGGEMFFLWLGKGWLRQFLNWKNNVRVERLGLGQPGQTWIFLRAQVSTYKLQVSTWYHTFSDAGHVNTEPREALIAADEVSQPVQRQWSLLLHTKHGSCVHTWDWAPRPHRGWARASHFQWLPLETLLGPDRENVKSKSAPAFPSYAAAYVLWFSCFNSHHLCSCFIDVQCAPMYTCTGPTSTHLAHGDLLFSSHITVLHPCCSSVIAISLCSVYLNPERRTPC